MVPGPEREAFSVAAPHDPPGLVTVGAAGGASMVTVAVVEKAEQTPAAIV